MTNNKVGSYVQRVERLNAEAAGLRTDIQEVYKEAKEDGVDIKAMRELIRRRKKTEHELRTLEERVQEYAAAVGQLEDTPLGVAARPRQGDDATA